MREIAGYYGRNRLRGTAAMTAGLSILALLYVWMFPSFSGEIDLDQYTEALPPSLVEAFGLRELGTIEGFLAAELYAFGWVILLGLYFAYAAGSSIAGDVERGRMDMLLSLPMRRWGVALGKFASLLVPLVAVNVVVPVVVYAAVATIDESIAVADLAAGHVLSVPYLLVCAGIGLLASVWFDRESLAERAAAGVVFGLFLLESAVAGSDFEGLGRLSPSRYYDPSGILIDGEYALGDAALMSAVALVLVLVSLAWFSRKDVN